MPGYPGRITRASLGPTYINSGKIGDPAKAADAGAYNLMCWQVAGMNGPAPRGFVFAKPGSAPLVTSQWYAFDPNQALIPMVITRVSAGVYTWVLPASGLGAGLYADMNAAPVAVNLIAALPFVQGTALMTAVAAVNTDGLSGTLNTFAGGTPTDFVALAMFLI